MYVRPSNVGARAVKLPENYSGNAFSSHSPYSDMPPPARAAQPRSDVSFEQVQYNDVTENTIAKDLSGDEKIVNDNASPDSNAPTAPALSLFSSLLPRTDLSRHFPFGHGIGSEELLILAVMLMVFLSGNEHGDVDSEFLLLLGLLLFAG